MKSRKRGILVGLLLTGGLLGLGLWQPWNEPSASAEPAAGAQVSTPQTAAVQTTDTQRTPAASGETPVAVARPIDAGSGAANPLASIEAQWCTHGAQAHRQSEDSLRKSHGDDPRADEQRSLAYAMASINQPTQRAQYAVRDRVLADWAARLQALGDERSLALASRLQVELLSPGSDERRKAYSRLLGMTLRSRDPFVVQMWLRHQRRCIAVQECEPLLQARWAEVEPANLYAWMREPGDKTPFTEAQWLGMAKASYARSYTFELQARLLALLDKTKPGLAYEQGLELIEAEGSEWDAMGAANDLRRACASLDASSPHRGTCARAAELLWNDPQPTWGGQMHALQLANELELREAVWPARLAQVQARSAEEDRLGLDAHFAVKLRQPGCEHHAERQQRLQAVVSGGTVKASEQALAKRKAGPN